jgi:hypothetical protein
LGPGPNGVVEKSNEETERWSFLGPARIAYIQTGPFVGGEVLDLPFTVRPEASLYALGEVNILSQVVVLTISVEAVG